MPSSIPLRVLILEDQPTDLELMLDRLLVSGFEPNWTCVQTEADYMAALNGTLDIILSDYSLPQFNALEALHLLQRCEWDIPFIVVTGSVSEEVAVECMKQGASDYLLKDRLARLGQAVSQALQAKRLRDEKRAAEIALRKTASFNQAVLDSLSAHIAVINQNGEIVAVNDAWQRFALENGGNEAVRKGVGMNFLDVCRRAGAAGDQEALKALNGVLSVFEGGTSGFVLEAPCNAPTAKRWFSMRVTPLSADTRGAVISYVDITDRMQVSVALEHELNLLRTLINNIPDAIYIKDDIGRLIDANIETVARMGVTEVGALIGKTDFDFYPPDLAIRYYTDDIQVIRSGEPIINREERLINFGLGEERWSLTTKVPILDKQGEVTGLVGIGRDITERRQTEQALRKSEMRFAKAFNASPVPIYIARLHDSTMIDANDSFLSFSGYHRDQAIGHAAVDLKIWETPDYRLEFLSLLREQGFIRDGETTFHTRMGEIRNVLVSAELIELDGEPCILCLLYDITEQKQAQQKLLAAELLKVELEKEKELIALKERFISTLSHDFRTPLAVIQVTGDLISLYYERLSPEKRIKYVREIQTQVKLMVEMVDEVLVIEQTRSGKLQPRLSQIDIVEFSQTLFDNLQLIDTAGHQFIFITEGQFAPVWLDEKLMRHILNNLLINAIKYSPEGGKVQFDVISRDRQLVFRISDQGIGISSDDQAHLFEEFYRARNTGTIPGTGLGLAIVKQSVEAHGGTIRVDSQIGVGTTFMIYLPADLFPPETTDATDRV